MADAAKFKRIATSGLDPSSRIERLLLAAEASWSVTITVHDLAAIFHGPDGASLLPQRHRSHRHPYCELDRQTRPGWDRACIAHCRDAVNQRAGQLGEPFSHRCWKGAREVVAPIRRDGVHVGTLFAGSWRGVADAPMDLPRATITAHAALTIWPSEQVESIASLLSALGDALVAEIERARRAREALEAPDDRAAAVRKFLHYRAHLPVGISELAVELGLSPSRASHAVRELFHQPFRQLLLHERLARARSLLSGTSYTAANISERVGFPSPYYFSRMFTKVEGMPPGKWRGLHRGRV